jgi:hypothetical protein
VIAQRQAVEATPPTSIELASHLNNLATHLAAQYDATGRRDLLDEVLATQRLVIEKTPPPSTLHATAATNLASHLVRLYDAIGDLGLLDEAWKEVGRAAAGGPREVVALARTRANLIRHDGSRSDRFHASAQELTVALTAFAEELSPTWPPRSQRSSRLRRVGLDPLRRRDLAQRVDGLLGDLAASLALSGEVDRAIGLIEGDRTWLSAPQQTVRSVAIPQIPVAWVMTSRWETIVITTTDDLTYIPHVVRRTHREVRSAVTAALNAARGVALSPVETRLHAIEHQRQTVDTLCDLTSEIMAAVPRSSRLLIVPLGICALLPYSSARHNGEHLIDHTTLTLGPSLAWARASNRERRPGPSIGAFHPGNPPLRTLDLEADRAAFSDLVHGTILDRPTAEKLLAHFDSVVNAR